jgi:hypothetical protein
MIPRPAILTSITVPTGGWTLKFYLSAAAEYDKTCSAVIPAGTYYMSGDNQSGDLLYQLQLKAQAAIVALGGGFATLDYFYACLVHDTDTGHRFARLRLTGNSLTGHPGNHVKIAWTESSAGLAEALGFDYSADDTSAGVDNLVIFIADYPHGFGWYSDEDGQLADYLITDANEVVAMQDIGFSDGKAKTVMLGERYSNKLDLAWLSRALTYSSGTDYGDLPPYPLTRNKGLECWWREARQGKQFRVYERKQTDGFTAPEVVTRTGDAATTLTDSSKAWAVNRWAGYILRATYGTWRGLVGMSQEFYIASNTSAILTVANAHPDGLDLWVSAETFTIWEHTYRTYVVDLDAMSKFAPSPMAPELDYYGIKVPLLRYVA